MDLGKIWRAVIEFDMLQVGDRVLIGFSGGKDSMLLTAALAELQRHAPFRFELGAFTVDTGFAPGFDGEKYRGFCQRFSIPWYSERINVPELVKDNSPCYSCAYFRRAVLNRNARERGFNKVALAHHGDDAVETFVINLFTSGQQKTFCPVTELSRSGITLIRPFVYYREAEIEKEVAELGFEPIKNPCPYDGNTVRQRVKEDLAEWNSRYPELYAHLAAAMRRQQGMELWPQKLTKEELVDKFHAFWREKP